MKRLVQTRLERFQSFSQASTQSLSNPSSESMRFHVHRNLRLSNIGFGAYRLKSPEPLIAALNCGIHLIDTAPNFEKGKSECIIGDVLKDRFEAKISDRDQLCIVTKSGYLDASCRWLNKIDSADTGKGHFHSLDPISIEADLTQSLQRLRVEFVDVLMLNNPERMMLDSRQRRSSTQMEDMIFKAFQHLGKEVERGMNRVFRLTCEQVESNHLEFAQTQWQIHYWTIMFLSLD